MRFTVRRMMVAVAIVGVGVAAVRMLAVRRSYLAQAAYHERVRAYHLQTQGRWITWEGRRLGSRVYFSWDEAARFHEAMQAKWERPARCPWLPVAPDPPEPE